MFSRILQVICFLGFIQYPQVDHHGLFSMGNDISGRYSYDTMYATKFECRQVHGRSMCRDWSVGRVDAHGAPLHAEGFVNVKPTASSMDVLVGFVSCALALFMCYCATKLVVKFVMKFVMKLFERKEYEATSVLSAATPSTDSEVISTSPISEVVSVAESLRDDISTYETCQFGRSLEECSLASEDEVEALLMVEDEDDDSNDNDDNDSGKIFSLPSE